ncbi:hypothetical protein [Pseudoduganella sp. HUAS MS19]
MTKPAANRQRGPDEAGSRHVLWLRISFLLVMVIALVLVLISYLNYSNYRKAFLEQNLTRNLIVAKDVRQTVLGGLNIGLEPGANMRLLPAIRDAARDGSGIRYIGVLDDAGAVIGDGDIIGRAAQWRKRLAGTAADAYWQASDADSMEVGIPFENNFHIKSGAVVIGYDRLAIEAAASDMRRKLVVNVAITLLCVVLLTFGGVYLATRKLASALAGAATAIDAATAHGKPAPLAGDVLGAEAAQEINEFTELSQRVVGGIAVLEHELAARRELAALGGKEEA